MRILLVKLSAIGDVVHALPLLEALKGHYPEAEIDWVVEEAASGVILGHPCLRNVFVSRRKAWGAAIRRPGEAPRVLREVGAFVRKLRGVPYDLVLDVQGLFKSGVLTALARGKRKLGLSDAREGARYAWTEGPAQVRVEDHAIARCLALLGRLGLAPLPFTGRIPVDPGAPARVHALLQGVDPGRPLVAVNPVAGWPTKLWEADRFAALGDALVERLGCSVVFTGGAADRPVVTGILTGMSSPALNLAGRTGIKDLACLTLRCRAFVSTDTGPMHVAAAMGCPTVALFGPTAPGRTGPYGKGHRVLRADTPCSPCFRKQCKDRRCMKAITVHEVIEKVQEALAWSDGQGEPWWRKGEKAWP